MHFESCQLTDSRMYIKVVNTRLEAEVCLLYTSISNKKDMLKPIRRS